VKVCGRYSANEELCEVRRFGSPLSFASNSYHCFTTRLLTTFVCILAFVQGSKTPCKNFTLTEPGKHPYINKLLHAAVFFAMTLDPRRIVPVVCLDVYLLDIRMASDRMLYML